jgi:HD-GYP domain-containing protein (c-di-GMP phosphodiesterase class II)
LGATLAKAATSQNTLGWYALAEQELSAIASAVRQDRVFALDEISRVATGMVDALRENDQLLAKAISGQPGDLLITNMVNAAVLAIKIAIGLGYKRDSQVRIAQAALLHDVGMFMLPEALVAKPEKLNPEERAMVERHPELGYQILSRLGSHYDWLAQVALQEHERSGGQGYPRGLKESQIHAYASIVGLVDVFDALLSPRPYRRRFPPHEAVRELLMAERNSFPSQMMKVLLQQVSVFPLGTSVRLNTGEIGVVKVANPRFPLRPVVEVSQAFDGSKPADPKLTDLSKNTLVHIVEVLQPAEVA